MNTQTLWYFKLGHASLPRIRCLSQRHQSIIYHDFICDVCYFSKQKKLSFPASNSITLKCFDLILIDIWGPMQTPSLYGHHYFLSIVDDHSC